jgi:DNA processing protein
MSVKGISRERIENIRKFSQWDEVEKYIGVMDNNGIEAVPYQADSYPEVLKNIEDVPVVLYMKGKFHPDDRFAIGMVGSRKHTAYGETVTQRIAGELSSSDFTVISGWQGHRHIVP